MQRDLHRSATGSTPSPDPTVLTTEALQREIAALKELVEFRIRALNDLRTSELGSEISKTNERFTAINSELESIERQRVEQKADTKAAVDAALISQKEAVKEQTLASERAIAKSEAATTKSIEQLGDKFDTSVDGLRRESADLKSRLTTAEATTRSEAHSREGIQSWQIAVVGFLLTAVVVLSNIFIARGGR